MKNLLGIIGLIAIGYMVYTYHSPVTSNLVPMIEKGIANTTSFINHASDNLSIQIPELDIQDFGSETAASRCSQPITYTMGTFSEEFGINKPYFIASVKKAEDIWEKATGKNLLEYKEDFADLRVNLVYDYRQETTTELKTLGIEINKSRESYNSVRSEYNTAKSAYLRYKTNYESRVLAFNTRAKIFESQVSYWNNQDNTSEEQYNKLMSEKTYLEQELIALKNMEQELKRRVDQVNGLAGTLNKLAEILNLNVNKYNTIGKDLGESYEEGLYVQNGKDRYIDIYEFQSQDQLVRIIAHEFGHALGIGHLDNDESIMHAISLSKNLEPTEEDLAAIAGICGLTPAS